MKKLKTDLILTTHDYELLTGFLNANWGRTSFDRKNAEDLKTELKKAMVVSDDKFPFDRVKLNSRVKIKAEDTNEIMELTLVTPDKADLKAKKISILAPIGTALLGFRLGQKVQWQVPAGKKTFTILQVTNPEERDSAA